MSVIRISPRVVCPGVFFALVFLLFQPDAARGQSLTAFYAHNELAVTIPYHVARAGAGTLSVDVLDPDGKILTHPRRQTRAQQGGGQWNVRLQLALPLPLEDLVWQRVCYRFTFDGDAKPTFEGTDSVSEILHQPVVHILGQKSYLGGSQAAIRLLPSDYAGHVIAGTSTVRVELLEQEHPSRVLYEGKFNRRGTAQAQFRFPSGLTGDYRLHFAIETPIGSVESSVPIRIENKVSILLTTEKPVYQPGQTIHIRALALDRADRRAVITPLTFEVEDSRGNKVFKKATTTDGFGVASAEFTLADEVNLGAYHLQALMGDANAPANSAQIAITVDRYVLPRFKVSVNFAAKDGRPRRDYRPGEHVVGVIHASYFFGEPVSGAEVTVKGSSMDVALASAGPVTGKTGQNGNYKFDLPLPFYLAGQPMSNGMAPVLIEAMVKDSSGHVESRSKAITVNQSALLITAAPEGGTLIPGLPNEYSFSRRILTARRRLRS